MTDITTLTPADDLSTLSSDDLTGIIQDCRYNATILSHAPGYSWATGNAIARLNRLGRAAEAILTARAKADGVLAEAR